MTTTDALLQLARAGHHAADVVRASQRLRGSRPDAPDEEVLVPVAHHFLAVTISREWDRPETALTCTAPEGAACRLCCANPGCEEGCYCEAPARADQGECLAVLWIENHDDGVLALYDGSRHPLQNGPVAVRWDGDNWVWRYLTDSEADW